MTSAQPGWYPDNTGTLRWWDGQQWTAHTQPAPGGWPGMPQAPAAPQGQVPVQPVAAPVPPAPARPPMPHAPQPQHPAAVQHPQVAQPQYPAQPHAPQPQYPGQPAQYPVQPPQAPAGASTKLRHQGAAWAVGAAVLLAVISSGIALGVADASAMSSSAPSEVVTQDDGETETYAPLVTPEPVSAEQKALLESVVQKYNDSIAQQDCAAYNATTSADFRANYSGECVPGFFDDFLVEGFSSTTLSATQSAPGLYELRVDETFDYNGESMTARYAYVLADDPQTGTPVIEMVVDRN